MINLPNKFSHTGKYENVINRIIDYCRSITPVGSPTVKVSGSNHGMVLTAAAQGVSGVQTNIAAAYFAMSFKDYILCYSTPSTVPFIRIAKTPKMRNSILTETIYGQVFSMGYPHNTVGANGAPNDALYGLYRQSSLSGATENQGVQPQYLVNDKILYWPYAVADVQVEAADVAFVTAYNTAHPSGTDTVPNLNAKIIFIEDNPRMWQAFFNQSGTST